METSYFVLGSSGKFEAKSLPIEAQFSPVFSIESTDLNGDGFEDLILGGNLLDTKLKFGKLDALHGLVLLGNGKGEFKSLSAKESGLGLRGEIRGITQVGNYLAIHLKNRGLYLYQSHLSKESSK